MRLPYLVFYPVAGAPPGSDSCWTSSGAYLPPAQIERIREAVRIRRLCDTRARSAFPASPTSPIRLRSPISWPTCTSTPTRSIAAILHDVIEDTPTAKARSRRCSAQDVAELVDSVSKLDQIKFKSRARGAGRKLPENAAGDGARHPRDHGQARRSHAQHAHHRRHAAAEAAAHRARDAGDLRADRRAPRPLRRSSWSSRTGFRALYPTATRCWSAS